MSVVSIVLVFTSLAAFSAEESSFLPAITSLVRLGRKDRRIIYRGKSINSILILITSTAFLLSKVLRAYTAGFDE